MRYHSVTAILTSFTALFMAGCGERKAAENAGSSAALPGKVPLAISYPLAVADGPTRSVRLPNLVPVPNGPPTFQVPAGTVLLSRDKPVTSSDDNPIIGSLAMITDGEKKTEEGYLVELLEGTQWVQIDLEHRAAIHAVVVWHYFLGGSPPTNGSACHDVVIQISDDPTFKAGFTTIYNNDRDDSSKLGKGIDPPYVESHYGLLADGKGAVGRYVRLYSRGSTRSDMNRYIEAEVFGIPK
jgi:hypothetical protein